MEQSSSLRRGNDLLHNAVIDIRRFCVSFHCIVQCFVEGRPFEGGWGSTYLKIALPFLLGMCQKVKILEADVVKWVGWGFAFASGNRK